MESIDIFRGDDLFINVKIDAKDSNTQSKRIMGENQCTLNFELNHYVNFMIGDYAVIFGEKYKINQKPVFVKYNDRSWKYTMIMKHEGQDLAKFNYMFLGADNTLTETEFDLTGNTDTFVDLVIQNALRCSPGWVKGEVVPSIYKTISFKAENCYNALGHIAEEFGTEFSIDGKKINLTKRENETGMQFAQGKGKGLYDITRENQDGKNVVTRLYAFGSTKNLPGGYRNSSVRLKMPTVDYVESNVDKYGIIESVLIFEDIYPTRTGKVTSVDANDIYKFIDFDIDFDLNLFKMPGAAAKITFNTGQLTGYTFDIESFNFGQKAFRILRNKEEKTIEVPSQQMRISIDDEYVLTDIIMPQQYIDAAEDLLLQKANAAIAIISDDESMANFRLTFDPLYLRAKKKEIQIGDVIWVLDPWFDLQKKIRVISTSRNIVTEWDFTTEVADVLTPNILTRIENTAAIQGRDLNNVQQSLANNPLLNGIGIFPVAAGGNYRNLVVDVNTNVIYRMP